MEGSSCFNGDMSSKMGKVDRIVAEKLNSARKRIQTRFGGFKDFDPSNEYDLTNAASVVEEELCFAKDGILTRIAGIDKDMNHDSSAFRQLKLEFRCKISEEILTGEKISGEGDVPIEVALIDVSTGMVVDVEQKASLCVEIVLLREGSNVSEGDHWFEENIVWDTRGKKSLLVGGTLVKLQRGIGVVNNIKFVHRASAIKPPRFCLGARVVSSTGWIKEAKTEPFTVKNFRKKYYVKHKIPSLTDCVYRLKNIRKGGEFAKLLQKVQIETVEDFLIKLLIDPDILQTIVGMAPKKWADTLTNARACRDKRMYCYADSQRKTAIVFNIFGEVLRPPIIMPSENQEGETQEFLLGSAYKHWEDVKHFDDENSLEEHLASLTTSWGATYSQMQNLPICSDLHPYRGISVDDYNVTSSLSTHDVESHNYFFPHSRSTSFNLGALWNFDSGPFHEPNVQEHIIDAAMPGFVGIQEVHNRRRPNGWDIFCCIWRLRSMRKKLISKRCTIA